jgi:predicted dehydrogenase
MGLRALEVGTHVLIEKPLSHSLQGIEELLRAREYRGRQAAVAYVYHMFPVLTQTRLFLKGDPLGAIRQAVFTSGQPFHRLRPAYAQTYYRDRRTGGGAIQDALTHAANWIESIIGPADSVLCDCAHLVLPDVDVEDTVHVSARHGSILANYVLNQFQAPNETTIQLNATRGSLKVEFHNQRWGIFREGDATWSWHEASVPDRDAHFVAQANAFLDQIEGKPSSLCSLTAAVQTLRFNLAALASAERNARVYCRDIHA